MLYEMNNNCEVDNGIIINSKTNTIATASNKSLNNSFTEKNESLWEIEKENKENIKSKKLKNFTNIKTKKVKKIINEYQYDENKRIDNILNQLESFDLIFGKNQIKDKFKRMY